MRVWKFEFTAKQLNSIHPDHLGFLVASSHCCNEIISMMPYLMFEHDIDKANEIERTLIQIRYFTLIRALIARIFEYRELCNNYISGIRKTYPLMAERLGKKSKLLSRRINNTGWANTVRNRIISHFDAQYALAATKALPPETKLNFIVGRMHGITAFAFAEHAVMLAMYQLAGNGSEEVGEDVIRKWTIELQRQITEFHADVTKELFETYGLFENVEELVLRDEYCAERGSVAIPLSILDKRP